MAGTLDGPKIIRNFFQVMNERRRCTRGSNMTRGNTTAKREEVEVEVKAPVDNRRQQYERGAEQEPEAPTE